MTENELEILRLKLRIEVLQLLLRGLYTGLANSSAHRRASSSGSVFSPSQIPFTKSRYVKHLRGIRT